MNMKKSILALAALAFMAWGCSTSDDDSAPKGILEGTDARPTWQVPNYDLYDQTMNVEVQLQDTLKQYASAADMMCVKVGDEVRAVADGLQYDDEWLFQLTIASNDADISLVLQYYCDKLHRIFTINWTKFDASVAPTGTEGIYKPEFDK
jgi:hypothetical protein